MAVSGCAGSVTCELPCREGACVCGRLAAPLSSLQGDSPCFALALVIETRFLFPINLITNSPRPAATCPTERCAGLAERVRRGPGRALGSRAERALRGPHSARAAPASPRSAQRFLGTAGWVLGRPEPRARFAGVACAVLVLARAVLSRACVLLGRTCDLFARFHALLFGACVLLAPSRGLLSGTCGLLAPSRGLLV
jgi:hypothetical protein